jgi:Protein of unknown function (DUF3515)
VAVATSAAVVTLAGCEGSVLHVTPPEPVNSAVPVCNRLNDQLPNLLEHLQSRPTRPRSPLVHAWGNVHPVVLRCGVPVPSGYSDNSPQTAKVNDVTWFQQVEGDHVVWTAIRTGVNVELTIPTHYEAQGAFLVDLGNAISATIP